MIHRVIRKRRGESIGVLVDHDLERLQETCARLERETGDVFEIKRHENPLLAAMREQIAEEMSA